MIQGQELQDLYRQTVLDHSRQPRNFSRLDPADRVAVGHNPLCGDKLTLYLNIKNDAINDITFEGTGCAISIASASIMTESVKNQSLSATQKEAEKIVHAFSHSQSEELAEGEMAALNSVRDFPSRMKCAALAWKTLQAAIDDSQETITTED